MYREKKCDICGIDITGLFGSHCHVCANAQPEEDDPEPEDEGWPGEKEDEE